MNGRFPTLAALVALAIALSNAGCGARESETRSQDPQQRAQELIDSGNRAYRAANYGLAARRYAAAAVVKKDDPAAYYGMGMSLSKLGRDEDARKAYARARELAASAPPASLAPRPTPTTP
jgi:Flp pilus assembly protein TadD